jgi:predicted nucleic acid-binding protein
MNILLDTNVVSELMKVAGDPIVLSWLRAQVLSRVYLSVTTLQEISYGIARMPAGRRRSALEAGLDDLRQRRFLDRILMLDDVAAVQCGELRSRADVQGRPAGLADAEIAAIAITHSMTVATRDVGDFARFGVPLVNPFDPEADR